MTNYGHRLPLQRFEGSAATTTTPPTVNGWLKDLHKLLTEEEEQ